MRFCSIEFCDHKHHALGFCKKHYKKFKKYGDPLFSKQEMHGMYSTPEYRAWKHMKDRCYNEKDPKYPRYGQRGIKVCARWLHSFMNFYNDMGGKPFLEAQIDRENNDLGYYKGNCRWTTCTINNRNQSTTKLTIEKARNIRKRYGRGNITQRILAVIHNVSQGTIWCVINNKTWKEGEI